MLHKYLLPYKRYAYGAGTIAAAYLISLIAWLDNKGEVNLIRRSAVGSSVEACIDTALLIVITPGWFMVTVVRGDRPGTRLTDNLIPILSGVFWGLLAILIGKLITLLLRYVRLR